MDDRLLKAHAIACLARREHSRSELRSKLLALARTSGAQGNEPDSRGTEAGVRVDAVLDWLESQRYQSQQRFVESRVRVSAERFGLRRIRQELAQHGLALPAQSEAALLQSEIERARAVWARKFAHPTCAAAPAPPDRRESQKQARFLAGRGFSSDVVRCVLRDKCAPGAGSALETTTDEETPRDTRATLPR